MSHSGTCCRKMGMLFVAVQVKKVGTEHRGTVPAPSANHVKIVELRAIEILTSTHPASGNASSPDDASHVRRQELQCPLRARSNRRHTEMDS